MPLAIVPTDETSEGGGGVGGGPFWTMPREEVMTASVMNRVAIALPILISNLASTDEKVLSLHPEFPRHRFPIPCGLHHHCATIQHVFSQCDGKRRRAGSIS